MQPEDGPEAAAMAARSAWRSVVIFVGRRFASLNSSGVSHVLTSRTPCTSARTSAAATSGRRSTRWPESRTNAPRTTPVPAAALDLAAHVEPHPRVAPLRVL